MGRVRKREALAAAAAAGPIQPHLTQAAQVELAPELQGDECVVRPRLVSFVRRV